MLIQRPNTVRDVLAIAYKLFRLIGRIDDLVLLCRPRGPGNEDWTWMGIREDIWNNLPENMEFCVGGETTRVCW